MSGDGLLFGPRWPKRGKSLFEQMRELQRIEDEPLAESPGSAQKSDGAGK